MLSGAYNATITKEKKNSAWVDIAEAIYQESPCTRKKTVDEVKKKWNNFTNTAKKEISLYKQSLTGTGTLHITLFSYIYNLLFSKVVGSITHSQNNPINGIMKRLLVQTILPCQEIVFR